MTPDGFRIVRVHHEGTLYTPVITAFGQVLGPEAVAALARTPHAPGCVRWLTAIVADEAQPDDPTLPRPQLGAFVKAEPVELVLGDSGVPIGVVTRIALCPPGALPDTEGRALLGHMVLDDTVLAAIARAAIQAGILTGFCAEIDCRAEAGGLVGRIGVVRLGAREDNHLPNARVLASGEAPA